MNQDNFATPPDLLEQLNIKPDLDVCASFYNSKAPDWFTIEQDALKRSWIGKKGSNTVVWCNPPHSKNKDFVKKAYEEFLTLGVEIYMLIPLNTLSANYAFKYIHGIADIKFIKGRIKFLDPDTNEVSKFPSRNGYVLIHYKRSKGLIIPNTLNYIC
jgi:site-specific DNA-methyltransferase (adenine-specific)